MAIKDIFAIITVQEFQDSPIFNQNRADNFAYSEWQIQDAINRTTAFFESLRTGSESLEDLWSTLTQNQRDLIQTACAIQVKYLLEHGVEYNDGSQSISGTGLSFSVSDTGNKVWYAPEIFIYMKKVGLWRDSVLLEYQTGKSCTPTYGAYLQPQDIYNNSPYITQYQGDNRYLKKTGIFYSSDSTINTPIVSIDPNTGLQRLNLTANIGIIADKLLTFSDIYNKIFNMLLAHGIENDLATKILADDAFKQALIDKLETDQDFIDAVGTAVSHLLENDADFKNVLENAITKLLENDSDFLVKLTTSLGNSTTFIQAITTKISDLIKTDPTIQDLLRGKINSIQAGSGVTIDSTDPSNPAIYAGWKLIHDEAIPYDPTISTPPQQFTYEISKIDNFEKLYFRVIIWFGLQYQEIFFSHKDIAQVGTSNFGAFFNIGHIIDSSSEHPLIITSYSAQYSVIPPVNVAKLEIPIHPTNYYTDGTYEITPDNQVLHIRIYAKPL